MILSSTAEFTPWVIQPKKDNQFTEFTSLTKTINSKENDEEAELNESETVIAEERDGEQFEGTELHDHEISGSPQSETDIKEIEETIAPELLPKYTTAEFHEYGETEYLRGYNSCCLLYTSPSPRDS